MQFEKITLSESNTASEKNPKLDIELDTLLQNLKFQLSIGDRYAQREWRKFTSDIKRMLNPSDRKDPPTRLKIDRRTFDLMLSFCFVGDIGYDPDDIQANA